MERPTPYHVPHSTEVAGYASIYGGDDRLIGNIFVGTGGDPADVGTAYTRGIEATTRAGYGSFVYDGHPASMDEFLGEVVSHQPGDVNIFFALKNPVYIRDNVYLAGSRPFQREEGALTSAADAGLVVRDEDGRVQLQLTLPEGFDDHRIPVVTTADLGRVRMVDADFEAPDGSPLRLGTDLLGQEVTGAAVAGPVSSLSAGDNSVTVWESTGRR